MEGLRDLISRVNSIDVLEIVYDNPGINQRAIIDGGTGQGRNSKLRRLKELVQADLIKEVDVSAGRTNKTYYVTHEGEKFFKNWLAIERGEDIATADHGTPPEKGTTMKGVR